MATTRKTTSRAASGTRKPSSARGKSSTSRSRSKKNTAAAKKPAFRREFWGLIWGLAGVITALSLLHFDGFILRWYYDLLAGLIGAGVYLVPVAMLAVAGLLFVKTKGPVRLRTASILVLPLCWGILYHSVVIGSKMAFEMKTVLDLFQTGISLKSGGLFAGTISMCLSSAFSAAGGMILMIVFTLAAILCAAHLTPAALWDMLQGPAYEDFDEYEEEEPVIRKSVQKPRPAPAPASAKSAVPGARKQKRKLFDVMQEEDKTEPAMEPEQFEKQLEKPVVSAPEMPANITPFPGPRKQIVEETVITPVAVPDEPELLPWEPREKHPEPDIASLLQTAPPPDTVMEIKPQPEEAPVLDIAPQKAKTDKEKEAKEKVEAELAVALAASQSAPPPVYLYPSLDLLNKGTSTAGDATAELMESSTRLVDTLQSFGIDATIINIVRGPSVTRFEMQISRGIKFSRITALSDDIALSLGAMSVRIAPIPDKVAIGIEVPNKAVQTVYIREVLSSRNFGSSKSRLSFALGKDITGAAMIGDIAKMPHMLIAGTTGSGKSVCINSMLISLLYKSKPEEVRLIMVDPKMVELGNYNGIPHLLIPVVTDPKKAAGALNWAVSEMERRYTLFAEQSVRDLVGYNAVMKEKQESGAEGNWQVLPQIVIVIDELADLMMVAAKEVETSICRIAQKARAAGMHLVVATQRPSADVITGIMKSNIPSRIAFAVASQIESRIILDTPGAEKLIGKGDMLYAPLGMGKPTRIQGCFISSEEIERVISHVKSTATVEYNEEVLAHIEKQTDPSPSSDSGSAADEEDELLPQAIEVVLESGQASVSMLQRRLKLGYSRAARLVDQMEAKGIVGPFEGSKPRQLLISKEDWMEMQLRKMD